MKKGSKSLFVLLLVSVLVLACAVPASADVIWTPEDDFFAAHVDECTYVGRRAYELAGQGGSVELWSAPDGTVIKELSNDEEFFASFSWPGETETWLCITVRGEEYGENATGWVRMADMRLLYDSQAFFEEHEEEIDKSGTVSIELDTMKFFPYPNGPEGRTWVFQNEDNPIEFHDVYTDEAGLRWGYLSYWYGYREQWVCLDEPMIKGTAEIRYASTPQWEQAAMPSRQTTLLLAAVLVAAVVVVTVVLIRKLPKRKESA